MNAQPLDRRKALARMAAGVAAWCLTPQAVRGREVSRLSKPIPASGEAIPAIGMGTWQTFNVGSDRVVRDDRTRVLAALFEAGGGMIDSSPMYGSSQSVVGYGLTELGMPGHAFSADKVWTRDGDATRRQVAESRKHWRIERFDLMQVHNLLSWRDHLDTLEAMRDEGRVRYIGVTTSHGRRHGELERVMRERPIDFVQLTYNATHRQVEERLLPLARDRGIAVIANRPFDGGALVKGIQRAGHPLPPWASEIDCPHWPAFLLKFIVSHPAVTCGIPATTRPQHMVENKQAELGPQPDAETRRRMVRYIQSL